jgi:two-component system response regulator
VTGTDQVLLVEDAEIHVEFTRLAFAQEGLTDMLRVARDGESALELLAAAERPPRLILLDLGLPRMSGFEVLQAVRGHESPDVRRTPVVVLTTSRAPADIQRAYDLCANSYVRKPLDLDEFIALVGDLRAWWLGRAELP